MEGGEGVTEGAAATAFPQRVTNSAQPEKLRTLAADPDLFGSTPGKLRFTLSNIRHRKDENVVVCPSGHFNTI